MKGLRTCCLSYYARREIYISFQTSFQTFQGVNFKCFFELKDIDLYICDFTRYFICFHRISVCHRFNAAPTYLILSCFGCVHSFDSILEMNSVHNYISVLVFSINFLYFLKEIKVCSKNDDKNLLRLVTNEMFGKFVKSQRY